MEATPRIGLGEVAKRLLLGHAIPTSQSEHQLLPKFLALPVFSSDALSSVAYATEEMMLVLALAGSGALSATLPLSIGIAVLLAIVVTSYRQTVKAYPQGGGSYIVAKENLGTLPGLVAAGAILCDYVLTVAVSVTAGTIAVTSAAPTLAEHKVAIGVFFVGLITVANLRGTKESGKLFAIPTYGFIALVGLTLLVGLIRCLGTCPTADTANLPLEPLVGLEIFLVLKAFASGATALTGVEAIADGVQAFRRPQSKNASQTLLIMAAFGITMFLGITLMAHLLQVRVTPDIAQTRSVLSQIGETVFGRTFLFFILQVFTAGVLILAANTSFQDFPRLSSILARDRFMPSQFRNRGDRLVFSNGVIVLAVLAALLIYVFNGELTSLIQLYVVGVFTAFTLSQTGMVLRWRKLRTPGWKKNATINGVGAAATGIVLVIVVHAKFFHGAWIVMVAIPILVTAFLAVRRHYDRVARLLRRNEISAAAPRRNRFLILVPDFGPETVDAVAQLRALRPESVTPLYVGPEKAFADTAARWQEGAPRFGTLESLPGLEHGISRALRRFLRTIDLGENEFLTVVLPEIVAGSSWWQLLHQRRALWLKASLLFRSNVVVMDVPLVPAEFDVERRMEHPLEPGSSSVLIPVSGVHDATARAVSYARSLRPAEIEAVFFAADPEESDRIIDEWSTRRMAVPLALIDAPFRDIGPPLLAEVRRRTEESGRIVTVVLPEFVVAHWWEHVLHNQTGLYIKRLLLLEPGVVVASVPYHLDDVEGEPAEASA